MDLTKQLLQAHTKANCLRVVRHVGNNAERFAELVQIFLKGPYRITQRAAWPLSYCIEEHPTLLKPHFGKILAAVAKPDAPVAVKRNVMRLLQFVDVPNRWQGKVVQLAFSLLQNRKETVAVQVFAMTVLANIAKRQPELGAELRVIIEDMLPFGSAGFRSRGMKVLWQIGS
jgi:hypothetical protein